MAYSALPAKIAGDTITLANWTAIKDNFEAGVPDIFTTAGDTAYATAANAAARLALGTADAIYVADASAPAWQNVPACRIYKAGNFDPTEDTWTSITFDTEIFDVNSMADLGANNTYITCPSGGDGYYLIGGSVLFDTSGDNTNNWILAMRILYEDATIIAEHGQAYEFLLDTVDVPMSICTLYPLNATDHVELQVLVSEDIDIQNQAAYSPTFWAIWQRRL